MTMNYGQLTFAREYRGYSQTELASKIPGLSQSNLSKYEKGVGQLSDEIIAKIVDVLQFPSSFFEKSIYNTVNIAHYRKRASINKKAKGYIERSNKLIGYLVDQMSESIEFPEFTLPMIDLSEGYSPEYVAQCIRRKMGVPHEPIIDIFSLLERFGIIVVEKKDYDEGFDGVSFFTDKGMPVIIINGNYSNDRKRLTLAHELGHIIMHLSPDFTIPEGRDIENEAYKFGAEFLMPDDEIRSSLVGLKLSYLVPLKQHWTTSMASIIRRAKELGCIDSKWYTYLNVELSRKGFKKNEPVQVPIDRPSLLYEAYQLHKTELDYSDSELCNIFCLPMDVLTNICHPRMTLRLVRK